MVVGVGFYVGPTCYRFIFYITGVSTEPLQIMLPNDEFLQARYTFDKWKPTVRSRKLRMVKTGSWLFGLLGTYKLVYTDWTEE